MLTHHPPITSLAEALRAWLDLTGIDPNQASFTLHGLDVARMHRELREALELDDTEATGHLLFDYLATQYFQQRTFSVEALLAAPDNASAYLSKSKALIEYLQTGDHARAGVQFRAQLRDAVLHYGPASPETEELLGAPHLLAILRRDAMRSMATLQAAQFLDGPTEAQGTPPVYGKFLYQWWNVNSLLRHLVRMPSGITVNMIRAEGSPWNVYFAFAIRNGSRVFLFTDKEAQPHPLAADFVRRLDRAWQSRANRHWFPYDLTSVAFDEEGRACHSSSERTELALWQSEVQPVAALSELAAPTRVWLTMMLDLLVRRFWSGSFRCAALSYTGEMIKVRSPLLAEAERAGLPTVAATDLELQPLRHADLAEGDWMGSRGERETAWLEQRYGARVPAETFNQVAPASRPLALVSSEEGHAVVALKAPHRLDWMRRDEPNPPLWP